MRIVILCSSPYSETGCAAAARLAQLGYAPVGGLTLPSWDRSTLTRKLGQWGLRQSLQYVGAKLAPGKSSRGAVVISAQARRNSRTVALAANRIHTATVTAHINTTG